MSLFSQVQESLENPDFRIIDVKTPEEYNAGHLKGAVNINLNTETFKEDIAKLDISKTYLIYCRSGNRSSRAISLMQKLEFAYIYHLANGIIEWNAEGLPVERGGTVEKPLIPASLKSTMQGRSKRQPNMLS